MSQVVRADSFPMLCVYEESDLTVPEELQTEVQQMMHRARIKSSSSETDEADGSQASTADMTVIRHKSLRRVRQGSVHSFGGWIFNITLDKILTCFRHKLFISVH